MIEYLCLLVLMVGQGLLIWLQYRANNDTNDMIDESRKVAQRSEQATEEMRQLTVSFGAYVERMEHLVK